MTLREFLAARLGAEATDRDPIRDIREGIQSGDPETMALALKTLTLGRICEEFGIPDERVEDFELRTRGYVEDQLLKSLILEYYQPQGWERAEEEVWGSLTMIRGQNRLWINITNDSNFPSSPPDIYPRILITCHLKRE